MNSKQNPQRFWRTLIVALSLASTAAYATDAAGGGNKTLNASYRFVTSETCVRSPFQVPPAAAFEPNTKQLMVDGETVNAVGNGLLRFFRDGSVTLADGRQTEISVGRVGAGTTPVAPPSLFTCSGTHKLQGNKLTMSLACNIKQPSPAVTVTLTPLNFEGHLGLDLGLGLQPIGMVNIDGDIQTITVSVNGNTVQQRQRICTQAISLTRVLR